MTIAELRKLLKTKLRFLSYVYTSARFTVQIWRTTQLIRRVQAIGSPEAEVGDRGVVVFNTVRTYIPIQLMTESMLALKLLGRGYKVIMLYDDGVLRHHDTLNKVDHAPRQPYYRFRRWLSLALLRRVPRLGKMLRPYSDFIDEQEIADIVKSADGDEQEYLGVDLQPFVRDSMVRFHVSVPDDGLLRSEPDYHESRKMFVVNCLLSLTVARKLAEQLTPAMFVTSHGIYTTWGPFTRYMVDHGIRTVTCSCNGFSINALDLAINRAAAAKDDDGYLEHFIADLVDNVIPKEQVINRVDNYMKERFRGATNDTGQLHHSRRDHRHELISRLESIKADGKKVFALFPNVMWDSAMTFEEWNRVFPSAVAWLVETVQYFAEASDKVLVVRVHPGEHTMHNVRKSIRDILEHHLGTEILENPNIILVPASEKLNSYELFDLIVGGIVYNGTIGLELIHRGIPLIVGAQTAYSDKGFTYDIHSRRQYFETFDHTDRVLAAQEKNPERAKYFVYEYFFLHGVPVQYMSTDTYLCPNWKGEPARVWRDANLDHIVSVMVGEEKYFQDYWRKTKV